MSISSYVATPQQASKALTLLICVAVILLAVITPANAAVGIAGNSPWWTRFSYPFFHASLIHASLNAWGLYAIVFRYDLTPRHLVAAFAIAAAIPAGLLGETPVLGISAIFFALAGFASFMIRQRLKWHLYMAAFIAAGFALPSVAAMIHLYAYLTAVIVSLITRLFHHGRN